MKRKKNDIYLVLGKSVCCKEVYLLKFRVDQLLKFKVGYYKYQKVICFEYIFRN